MLQYVLRRSTTIYPLYALLGMLYWPDDSLSLSLFAWPLEGYDLFMEDIPRKTIEIQEVSSTPINNHLWGDGFLFCVHPYLFTKMNSIRQSYFKMGGSSHQAVKHYANCIQSPYQSLNGWIKNDSNIIYTVGPYYSCKWGYGPYIWPKINRIAACFFSHPFFRGVMGPSRKVVNMKKD